MNYSGIYTGGIRPRLRRPSLRQSVSGGGSTNLSFDNWEDWRADMRASGGLTTSPTGWRNLFQGLPNGYWENGTNGTAASWPSGSHITLNLARPALVSGLRVYVGNNFSWGFAGERSFRGKFQGKNSSGSWEDIATDIELVDGGYVGNGSAGGPYLEEGDVQDTSVPDGTSTNGNWRRTYGWTPTQPYQEYRLVYTSKSPYAGGYWYTTEMTLRIEEF